MTASSLLAPWAVKGVSFETARALLVATFEQYAAADREVFLGIMLDAGATAEVIAAELRCHDHFTRVELEALVRDLEAWKAELVAWIAAGFPPPGPPPMQSLPTRRLQ